MHTRRVLGLMLKSKASQASVRNKLVISAFSFFFLRNVSSFSMTSTKKIFCYGDSLTAGTSPPFYEYPYAKYLEEKLRKVPGMEESLVRWKGYPGWTSTQLLKDGGLPSMIDKVHASAGSLDLVIILAGTNDLAYESDSQIILDSITDIHDVAHLKGCNTIALSVPPSAWQAQSDSAKALANDLNVKLESWANKSSMATFVPFPIQEFDRNSGDWATDGLHFSAEGYQKIGESLAPIVENVLKRNENK